MSFSKARYSATRQGHLGRDQTLHHRVIGQIHEHGHMSQETPLSAKVRRKIFCHIVFYAHGGKDNRKFFIGIISQRCLHARSVPPAGHGAGRCRRRSAASVPGSGSSGRRWQKYRYGYSFADIHWVTGFKGLPFTSSIFSGKDLSQSVDRITDAVQGAAQHIRRHADLHRMPGQAGVGIF